jgi:hypothetical protein
MHLLRITQGIGIVSFICDMSRGDLGGEKRSEDAMERGRGQQTKRRRR